MEQDLEKGNNRYTTNLTVFLVKDQGTIKLDNNGQAKIWLASAAVNDNAEPIVWVDQNTGTNHQGGTV